MLPGGVVTDASFTGVSTQYLVRMPWGQELMVFAQNLGGGGVLRPGTHGRPALGPGPHVRARRQRRRQRRRRARRGRDARAGGLTMSAAQGIGLGEQQEPRTPARTAARRAVPRRRGRRRTPYLLLLPGMAWLAIFFIVPLVTLLSTSTQTRPEGAEIGVYTQTFRFANYTDDAQRVRRDVRPVVPLRAASPPCSRSPSPTRWPTRSRSRPDAGATCCWCWWSRRSSSASCCAPSPGSRSSPTRAGSLTVLQFLHVLGPQDHIINSAPAVVIGITYNFLPFMILPIYASLERVDPRLMEAAGDLYANALTTLRKVTFPLSMPGVVAGTLLTFIPAAGDYVNSALLGNRNTTMVGNVIDSRFLRVVDYPTAAVLSVSLMVVDPGARRFYIRRAGTEELV